MAFSPIPLNQSKSVLNRGQSFEINLNKTKLLFKLLVIKVIKVIIVIILIFCISYPGE